MKTTLTTSPGCAAKFIKGGAIAAFPTETVYGLGASVFDETAVEKIFLAKHRPADNPLIIHVAETSQIAEVAEEVPDVARRLIDAFFPGPLTLVLRRSSRVPLIATAGLESVGIRQPRLSLARAFLQACSTPVAAPSANLSGRPSPTTWEAVAEDLDGRIDCILQGPPCELGLESTVVDCTTDSPMILRSGSIGVDELRSIVATVAVGSPDPAAAHRSPGLRHRHYSPRARVLIADKPLVEIAPRSAFIGLRDPPGGVAYSHRCSDVHEYARELFAFFREADRRGLADIYCQPVAKAGIGVALMDRIERAARS